jgi:hypothetical protein
MRINSKECDFRETLPLTDDEVRAIAAAAQKRIDTFGERLTLVPYRALTENRDDIAELRSLRLRQVIQGGLHVFMSSCLHVFMSS